jgi:diguanylate cyclase (GGDEF)-like protein
MEIDPRAAGARLLAHADLTSDLVGIADDGGNVVYMNEAARKRLGLGDATDLTMADVFPPEAFARYYEEIRPELLRRHSWHGEIAVYTAPGVAAPISASIVAAIAPGGEVEWMVIYGRELATRNLEPMNGADELTGLPQRAVLAERLDLMLRRARRDARKVGVAFVDLDALKPVNDVHGHHVGDQVLQEVARRMLRSVRAVDTVARFGGDEFVLLFDDVRDRVETVVLADRVRDALCKDPIRTTAGDITITASFGVAVGGAESEGADLLRRADAAMYRAKDEGSGRIAAFDESITATVEGLTRELAVAVSHGLIEPYVQPIVDLATGTTVGYQGLARWRHPTRGLLEADSFIALVADSPASPVLDLSVARAAIGVAVRSEQPLRTYVHCSGRLLAGEHPEMHLAQVADAIGLPYDRLAVEISQALLARRSRAVSAAVHALHETGVRLVLTDVADVWDVNDIVQYGFREIRLARRVVASVSAEPGRVRVVQGTVGLAHGLGLDVTAVPVETQEQRELLASAGVDFGQGRLFGAAVPAAH